MILWKLLFRGDRLKRLFTFLLFTLSFFTFFTTQVDARSFSIDDVHIRAYISPDGNLLINEMFTYTFDGSYEEVRRSIHNEHHQGVKDFEAYELMNDEAVLGFMEKNDLRQLEVSKSANDYMAKMHVTDTTKKIVFVYILENAVKSYNTYSDITAPFFGTGQNHNSDLNNVTIDFVFPEPLEPNQYHAFFHDEKGWVVQKSSEVVRFFTPVSKARKLTETRILFPSTIMGQQQKNSAPKTLEQVLNEEEKKTEQLSTNTKKTNSYSTILTVLSCIFGVAIIILLLLPQRILRRNLQPQDLLHDDPLYLYMMNRGGVKDNYAFLAGIYSLVEKGNVKVETTNTLTRFQTETDAPKKTLTFSYQPTSRALNDNEKQLIEWLFTRKRKLNIRTFSFNSIYGATKEEKEAKKVHSYHRRLKKRRLHEDLWYRGVIDQLIENKTLNGKLYPIATRASMILVLLCTIITYIIGAASGYGIIVYFGISTLLWRNAWSSLSRKKVISFFLITFLLGWIALDEKALIPSYLAFHLVIIAFYLALPRFFLSREAAEVKAKIRSFRRMISQEGIPTDVDVDELDKWLIRALLLNVRKFSLRTKELNQSFDELVKIAPLSALVIYDEDPMQYLFKTWKWSEVSEARFWNSSSSGSNSNSGDGGSSYSSSDSGGGDGGGGAGAD